jgi:predicted transcriptional regulator
MDKELVKLLREKGWITEEHENGKVKHRLTEEGKQILKLLRELS